MTLQLKAEVINDIKVINNERISKETILIFADIKIGENYDQNNLNKILKEIYDTNFFSNVSLEINCGSLGFCSIDLQCSIKVSASFTS